MIAILSLGLFWFSVSAVSVSSTPETAPAEGNFQLIADNANNPVVTTNSLIAFHWQQGSWFAYPLAYRNPRIAPIDVALVTDRTKMATALRANADRTGYAADGSYDPNLIDGVEARAAFAFRLFDRMPVLNDLRFDADITSIAKIVKMETVWIGPEDPSDNARRRFDVSTDRLGSPALLGAGRLEPRSDISLQPRYGLANFDIWERSGSFWASLSCNVIDPEGKRYTQPLCDGPVWDTRTNTVLYLRFPYSIAEPSMGWPDAVIPAFDFVYSWRMEWDTMGDNFTRVGSSDLSEIRSILDSGRDFYRGYDILAGYDALGNDRQFWFDQASIINRMANDRPVSAENNLSGRFIIDYSAFGLAMDEKIADLRSTSDSIARKVLQTVIRDGGVDPLGVTVSEDISAALELGGQTLGGWAGSFYYWDVVAPSSLTGASFQTIGQYIQSNPAELEKFVSSATVATWSVVVQEIAECDRANVSVNSKEISRIFDIDLRTQIF